MMSKVRKPIIILTISVVLTAVGIMISKITNRMYPILVALVLVFMLGTQIVKNR